MRTSDGSVGFVQAPAQFLVVVFFDLELAEELGGRVFDGQADPGEVAGAGPADERDGAGSQGGPGDCPDVQVLLCEALEGGVLLGVRPGEEVDGGADVGAVAVVGGVGVVAARRAPAGVADDVLLDERADQGRLMSWQLGQRAGRPADEQGEVFIGWRKQACGGEQAADVGGGVSLGQRVQDRVVEFVGRGYQLPQETRGGASAQPGQNGVGVGSVAEYIGERPQGGVEGGSVA